MTKYKGKYKPKKFEGKTDIGLQYIEKPDGSIENYRFVLSWKNGDWAKLIVDKDTMILLSKTVLDLEEKGKEKLGKLKDDTKDNV